MESRHARFVVSVFAGVFCAALMSGCASVATESAYVFLPENAIDNPNHKDPFCAHIRNYKGAEPAYFSKYYPEVDFTARLQLLAPRVINQHSVGPGVIVPLPVIPDPVGNGKAAQYRSAPEAQFETVKIAVYPDPFRSGYFFTPSQVWLETSGKALHPIKISRHFSVNHENRQKVLGIVREKLPSQSGEFNAYVLEFNVKGVAGSYMNLHMAGFDREGMPVARQVFRLVTNQAQVFDWKYDTDCNI
ncbi:MAG: hypothetical protein IPK30_11065 [Cellvibrionales bacterium]|jgi:hypothetical protein|nr:hypothetical protein [Cellvibrionales bacterium]